MNVRIEIKIGDKIIANEEDILLISGYDPRGSVDQATRLVYEAMGKAVDRALEELLVKEAIPKSTSNPARS